MFPRCPMMCWFRSFVTKVSYFMVCASYLGKIYLFHDCCSIILCHYPSKCPLETTTESVIKGFFLTMHGESHLIEEHHLL